MGQQQLLLIILGVIIVGIAVGVGISQFSGNNEQANKDGVTSSLMNLSADAFQFRIRPRTLGGGSHSYTGYRISSKVQSDDNGNYTVSSSTPTQIVFKGTSVMNSAWSATCTVDSTGKTTLSYSGW